MLLIALFSIFLHSISCESISFLSILSISEVRRSTRLPLGSFFSFLFNLFFFLIKTFRSRLEGPCVRLTDHNNRQTSSNQNAFQSDRLSFIEPSVLVEVAAVEAAVAENAAEAAVVACIPRFSIAIERSIDRN